jgi:uncharacterized DUF497 family protein
MASILEDCEGFEWDQGNSEKNWRLHGVTDRECEDVFSNEPIIIIVRDKNHSETETRYAARGITNSGRRLTVIFTIRDRLVRVISARNMTRREEKLYEEKAKRHS